MALLQLDLFGWVQQSVDAQNQRGSARVLEITVDDLADSLIRYFGDWMGKHQNLLEDDWTVCETLIGIHKRYTREQLRAVYKAETWYAAWGRFNHST